MQQLIAHYGMLIVSLLVCVGEIGVPTGIPVEVVLLLAGAYSLHSPPALAGGIVLAATADLLGASTLNLLMRTSGSRLLGRLLDRHAADAIRRFDRWRGRLGNRTVAAIALGRVLPLLRMYVTIASGLIGVPYREFALGAFPAAVVWTGIPLMVGYLARGNVRQIATQYTRVSHLALVAVPILVVLAAFVWWVHLGGSRWIRLHRLRAIAGLVAAVVLVGYLAQTTWEAEAAIDQGQLALPVAVLVFWLILLAVLALGVLTVAARDLSRLRRRRPGVEPQPGRLRLELVTTIAWLVLVVLSSALILGLEFRYPAL